MKFGELPIAQGMLPLHAEKTSFPECGSLLIGQINLIQIGNRTAIGKKKGIQRTAFLRGIFFIAFQKTVKFVQRKAAFQENDFIAVLIKVFKGMVSLICYFEKICEAVAGILRIFTEFFINHYLVALCIQIHLLDFPRG